MDNSTLRVAVREYLRDKREAILKYGLIESWDVSRVTDMSKLFYYDIEFNPDLSRWDVSSVTNMSRMFSHSVFNSDISCWDVSSVTDMHDMFYGATAFNGDLSGWSVGNVTNMSFMFGGAMAFNSDLSGWNVGNVTDMKYMFSNALAFNSDLSRWNVGNVTNMSAMFLNASSFNSDISLWNVGNVTYMDLMLVGASSFTADSGWMLDSNTGYVRKATRWSQIMASQDIKDQLHRQENLCPVLLTTISAGARVLQCLVCRHLFSEEIKSSWIDHEHPCPHCRSPWKNNIYYLLSTTLLA